MEKVKNIKELLDMKRESRIEFQKAFRRLFNYQIETSSVEIQAILQGVLAELAAIDQVIEVLPDGTTKINELKRKVKPEYKNSCRKIENKLMEELFFYKKSLILNV